MLDFVQEGDLLAEKYRVKRVLERGGMGVVVAAQHVHLDQSVALKLLPPAAAEDSVAVRRFLREARAAAHIQNEHIVRVSDVGTLDSGAPYMVMELLDGMDFAKVLRASGALPIANAVDYLLQVCEGVAEAHRLGIVHRDLKPSNLFLTRRSDGSPLVKVLDFGISKLTGSSVAGSLSITSTAAFIGSPAYMSPEQVRSAKDVDTRTDIWSLGVVLHELLTGAPAFQADSAPAVMAMIAADPPVQARRLRPDIPADLEAVILHCLQKDRTHRYASVADLAAALAPFGSPQGKASAAFTAKILRMPVPESATTASTQVSREPPSSVPSTENTAHEPPARHSKGAVVAMGGLAIAIALGGLMFRRGEMGSTRSSESPSIAITQDAPLDNHQQSHLEPPAASDGWKGTRASPDRPAQPEAPSTAEPSPSTNHLQTRTLAGPAAPAAGRPAASAGRTSKRTSTVPAESAPPLSMSAIPVASSAVPPPPGAGSVDLKARVFDHRTF